MFFASLFKSLFSRFELTELYLLVYAEKISAHVEKSFVYPFFLNLK